MLKKDFNIESECKWLVEKKWEFFVLFFPKWRQKQACLWSCLFAAQTSPSLTASPPSSNSTKPQSHFFSSLIKMIAWLHTVDRRVVGGRTDQLSSHIPSITKPQVPIFTLPTGRKIAGISADLLSVVNPDPGASRSRWKWRISTMTLTTATSWPFLDTDKNGENKAWLSLLAFFFPMNLLLDASFSNLHQALYSHHLSRGWYYSYMMKGCEASNNNKPLKRHDCST